MRPLKIFPFLQGGFSLRMALLLFLMAGFAKVGLPAEVVTYALGQIISEVGRDASSGRSPAENGARMALEEVNVLAGFFSKRFSLVTEKSKDSREAARKMKKLIERDGVIAVLGNLDEESSILAAEVAQEKGTPYFNCRSKANPLRGKYCHRFLFHIEAAASRYGEALGRWLIYEKNLREWYFVRGTSDAEGRLQAAAVSYLLRNGGREIGSMTLPEERSDYPALFSEIREKAPEAVFVTLEGEEQHQFLRRYAAENLPFQVVCAELDFNRIPLFEKEKVKAVWPVLWFHELFRYGARELNNRFVRKFDFPMDSIAWANWAAVKMVGEAVVRTKNATGRALVSYLESAPRFDGNKGEALLFRAWNHQLEQPLYLLASGAKKAGEEYGGFALLTQAPPPDLNPAPERRPFPGNSKTDSACKMESL